MRKEASKLHPAQSRERRQDPTKAKERVSIAEAETGLGQIPARRWEAEPVESRAKERKVTKHCLDCGKPMHRNAAGWWCSCGKRIMNLPKGYKKQKKVKK